MPQDNVELVGRAWAICRRSALGMHTIRAGPGSARGADRMVGRGGNDG